MNHSEEEGGDHRPYSGRWIAELRGKVIAQGGTPEQARQAAIKSRYKEKPEIIFMKNSQDYHFPPLFYEIQELLADEQDVFLVGGAVRDSFLGKISHDLDFAVKKGAIQLARKVANSLDAAFYPLDDQRDAGRIIFYTGKRFKQVIDFAAFRGKDLEEDLMARDFTVNALAVDLKDMNLYDPLGGVADIWEKNLRACSDSSILDDPLRILRAIRLAASFDFHIQAETRLLIKNTVHQLPAVSSERLRDELFRILQGPRPSVCLKALDLLGALHHILPELQQLKDVPQSTPHVQNVWSHSLSVISHLESILSALSEEYNPDTASNYFHGVMVLKIGRYRRQITEHLSGIPNIDRSWREILLFSGLYHDISKSSRSSTGKDEHFRYWGHEVDSSEVASNRARYLCLSNDEVDRIGLIVKNHMRIHYHSNRLIQEKRPPSKKAIYRFFRDAGEAGVDICLLTLADLWATYENTLPEDTWVACLDVVRIFMEAWWEKRNILVDPPRLISGEDIMKNLEMEPGPEVGILLEAVREAQVTREIHNTKTAIDYARDYGRKLLKGKIKEFIKVDDLKLACFSRPGRGIPLLLVHGYPLDHSIWHSMIPYLDKNLFVLMPDLPGFGESEVSVQLDSMEKYADILVGVLDSLRIKVVLLVGHSMGGYAALALAKKYPQRLSGLGLVASRTGVDSIAQKESRQKMIKEIQVFGMKPVAESMLEKLTPGSTYDHYLEGIILGSDPMGAVHAIQAMIDRQDTSEVLRSLKIPTLVLAGIEDALIPIHESHQLASGLPGILYHELEGVGHMPMLEAPGKTAQLINLLAGLSRKTSL